MKKAALKLLTLTVFAIAAGVGIYSLWDQFRLNPMDQSLALEYPSYTVSDNQGATLVIDRSLKRITKISSQGELVFTVNGGDRAVGKFYFADEICTDEQANFYLLNRIMDLPGFYTVATEIQKYSPEGKLEKVVYRRDYSESERVPTLVQRGQWMGLKSIGSKVVWFDAHSKGLDLYELNDGDAKPIITPILSAVPADLLVSSAELQKDGWVVIIQKNGTIGVKGPNSELKVLYTTKGVPGFSDPWKVRSDAQGRIYYTDLGAKTLNRLESDGRPTVILGEDDGFYYSLSISPGGLLGTVTSAGSLVINPDTKEKRAVSSGTFTTFQVVMHFLIWGLIALSLVLVILIIRTIYVDFMKRKVHSFFKTVMGVILLTAAVGGLVSAMILGNLSQRYSSEVLNKIKQLVTLVPQLLDTEKLQSIQDPSQFMNEDYQNIRSKVIKAIYGEANDRNSGLYFALHRIKDDGKLYTFMWLNGEPSIWHPFTYLWDEANFYQRSLKGEIVADSALDAWGSWMLSTSPIRDKTGKIIGVFEMGGDFYSFTQENNRLIQNLMISILTIVVMFLLMMVEGTFLSDQMHKRSQVQSLQSKSLTPRREEDKFTKVFLVRPLSVVFFAAASMSLMFLPLVMKNFYQSFLGLPENVVYALPISLRLLFFGIGTIVAGFMVSKMRWRGVFFLGLGITGVGLIGAGFSTEMYLFMVSSIFIGLGTGLSTIGMRAIINGEQDPEHKASGYSHFYSGIIAGTSIGVIAGSWMADYVGYSNVFFFSLIIILASFFMALRLFPKADEPPLQKTEKIKSQFSLGRFLINPRVLGFFLLVVIPVYAASMFLGFFMPVFAQAQNLSNSDIGRIFLLNGVFIIYLGPSLAKWARKALGVNRSLIVSSLLWIIALIPFIIMGNIPGVIITVALMGIAEGVAAASQNEYFLGLKASRQLGADKATGIFEVMGKLGETAAPILIGFALILGPQMGVGVLVLLLALTTLLFLLTGGLKKDERE